MRVYVETNFVLELILEQAQLDDAERLLELADALVFASVLQDLNASPASALFVTTNFKDFNVPSVTSALASAQCELITKFSAARARAEAVRSP